MDAATRKMATKWRPAETFSMPEAQRAMLTWLPRNLQTSRDAKAAAIAMTSQAIQIPGKRCTFCKLFCDPKVCVGLLMRDIRQFILHQSCTNQCDAKKQRH
jgi:hypothetical protein